tara:strand:- start:163 stop:351 length:189 start_codon:yes stop_codon:yes gene_type:complete
MLAVAVVAPILLVELEEWVVKAAVVEVVQEVLERLLVLEVQAGLLMVPLEVRAVVPKVEQEL